jgi:hypothetical protein
MAINHFKFFFSLTVFFSSFFLPAVCLEKKEVEIYYGIFSLGQREREKTSLPEGAQGGSLNLNQLNR